MSDQTTTRLLEAGTTTTTEAEKIQRRRDALQVLAAVVVWGRFGPYHFTS